MLLQDLEKRERNTLVIGVPVPKQHHTQAGLMMCKDPRAEIVVLRDNESSFPPCQLKNFLIGNAGAGFRYREDIASGVPEYLHNTEAHVFVHKKVRKQ